MIERWVRFWERREGPASLALTRILVGLVLFADFGQIAVRGLVPGLWLAPPRGLGFGAAEDGAPALLRWLGATPAAVTALWAVVVLGALGVSLGWALREAALAAALGSALLGHLAPSGERAIDALLRIVLVVLALSRADASWSLRSRFERGRGREPVRSIPAWPRQLLFAQLVWVYFSAAHNRSGPGWWPSGHLAALSHVLSDPHFAVFSPGWTRAVYPLTQVATALTMTFELGAPLLFALTFLDRHPERGGALGRLVRRLHLRWAFLALGAGLHLGIAVTMRLGIFPFGMLALYPLFLHPSELSEGLARGWRVACAWRVE